MFAMICSSLLTLGWHSFYTCRCPDTIRVKDRMIYASTNEVLKKSFHGIKQFECHDEDEFSFKEIAERLEKSDRA